MKDDKIALVSGGNRGLGLETCRQLLEHGFRVLLGSRDLDAGIEAANAFGSEHVAAVRLDVTDSDDIAALAQHIEKIHGRLDVLINNAGILIDADLGDPASIRDTDAEVLETTFRTNVVGPILLINAMLPLMERVDDARIVNISSGMGQLSGMGGQYPGYRISKTALNAATCIYAAELDPARFSINAASPGWVRTDMGGEAAELSVEEGVDTVVWLATAPEARVTGGFYRSRERIDW